QNCSRLGAGSMNLSLFRAASDYRRRGMPAFADLQQAQFEEAVNGGYGDWKHHSFVGTGYFDDIARTIAWEGFSTAALAGSTEESQF
ncbi:MAG: isocitrate lyase, partial [Terriglobia bacterium]